MNVKLNRNFNQYTYSVFHGQKIFKAVPGLHFSLESLTGAKPTKTEFQVLPRPIFSSTPHALVVKCIRTESQIALDANMNSQNSIAAFTDGVSSTPPLAGSVSQGNSQNLMCMLICKSFVFQGTIPQVLGSSLQIFRYHDILIGNFPLLQEFVRQGYDRNKIFDLFAKLGYDDLTNPTLEVVRTTKEPHTGRHFGGRNFGGSSLLYSKTKLGDSFTKDAVASKNGSALGSSRNNFFSSPSRTNNSRIGMNESKMGTATNVTLGGNKDNTTMMLGNSVFLGGDNDRSSMTIDLNNTLKTNLALDPAERQKQARKQADANQGGKGDSKQGLPPGKLAYEDFTKATIKTFQPEGVYQQRAESFNHLFDITKKREARQKKMGQFMTGLHREMEERKIKERREELKAKINQKVPKKVKLEEFLTNKVI